MRPAYYNELDSYAAQWLRNLIKAGHIPAGDVDDRSIKDVAASDLDGYGQCHWFAGIGGGALACRLAGWSDDREIWTGGPPCQDNSNAAAIHGGRTGLRGERSGLALTWLDLVGERLPATVIFENVPGISPWLAEITDRLESFGYGISRHDRSAAGSGAPHLRRRVFVAANRDGAGLEESRPAGSSAAGSKQGGAAAGNPWCPDRSWLGVLDDGLSARLAGVRTSIIHGFGNAWVPQTAAEIIKAVMEVRP
jgi:DNA (cytosine-5)-methyltransferase 1